MSIIRKPKPNQNPTTYDLKQNRQIFFFFFFLFFFKRRDYNGGSPKEEHGRKNSVVTL